MIRENYHRVPDIFPKKNPDIRYWKCMEILNGKEISSIWAEFYWRQSISFLCSVLQCVKLSFMIKNFEKCREAVVLNFLNLVLKKYGKWFLKMHGNPGSLYFSESKIFFSKFQPPLKNSCVRPWLYGPASIGWAESVLFTQPLPIIC